MKPGDNKVTRRTKNDVIDEKIRTIMNSLQLK
jgi:hypothetical protein